MSFHSYLAERWSNKRRLMVPNSLHKIFVAGLRRTLLSTKTFVYVVFFLVFFDYVNILFRPRNVCFGRVGVCYENFHTQHRLCVELNCGKWQVRSGQILNATKRNVFLSLSMTMFTFDQTIMLTSCM